MGFWNHYQDALNFLAGGDYSKTSQDVSVAHGGEHTLGQWAVAAGIYAAVRSLFG